MDRWGGSFFVRAAAIAAAIASVAAVPVGADPAPAGTGDLPFHGAFTCDLTLDRDFPADQLAPVIERDRMYMASRPGLGQKHIPVGFDPESGNIWGGGRYLFDTVEDAEAYRFWAENVFTLDGVKFFDRPEFIDHECHVWSTIGAHDFGDIHTSQVVLRTERLAVPAENQRPLLKEQWPLVRDEAERRGYTSVWLLYNKQERLVSLVYFANRIGPTDPQTPDWASLTALASAPPLSQVFADQHWTPTFDRTQWVLTIWFPVLWPGDVGEPSLWPNSPPFPQPSSTDGVCEPSRGESNQTAPNDCSPRCGDQTWDAEENNRSCPSDVPFF